MMFAVLVVLLGHRAASRYDVTDFGAVGDGETDDTKSIVKALSAAAANAKATVYFPPKKIFLTGPINMTTGLTLQVECFPKRIKMI